jgi:hypothetical protein
MRSLTYSLAAVALASTVGGGLAACGDDPAPPSASPAVDAAPPVTVGDATSETGTALVAKGPSRGSAIAFRKPAQQTPHR